MARVSDHRQVNHAGQSCGGASEIITGVEVGRDHSRQELYIKLDSINDNIHLITENDEVWKVFKTSADARKKAIRPLSPLN